MTKPTPAELLAGVGDALEQNVLPDLDRGPARNQVMAAIGIVRRCSGAFDQYGPMLHADCLDISATLHQTSAADPSLATGDPTHDLEAVLAASDGVLSGRYPLVAELSTLQVELSEALAQVLLQAQRLSSDQLPVLRQLLSRMTERETQLGLSPW
jgi:hypothetical protein